MKNKQIDFFIRKKQWKKENQTNTYGPFAIVSAVVLLLLLLAAAFLIFDTNRMEKKISEGEAMLQDPQLLQFYEEVEELNQREAMYLSIKDSLANLDSITSTYPNVDTELFNHLLLGNDPGVVISNLSYDGASGQLSFGVTAKGYWAWDKFIVKLEKSPYFTGFNYYGYDRDIANDEYAAGFSVQLVKVEKTSIKKEGE